ncbi:hypothetical protein E2P81_ATG10683 [Venturia nashicola]|uniref:Uncharacterized protein n=1 Tax=Venturia nashicola TaxID=86259 RepID=A0A4Z1P9W5_9PEZI|nr:hypothetical protein E6O75_ATG10352 [Venturia nashicola]TLD27395.1 hypothetical protein E2P81_ATG10683 [Venturia nashicola]
MAPVESSVANSNALPLTLLALHTGIITTLVATITRFILRVHSSLPPSLNTRDGRPWHKKSIALFSLLAITSLGLATYHALAWRYASYQNWATESGVNTAGSLWGGWYAGANANANERGLLDNGSSLGSLLKGEGWQLGRWMQDSDLLKETNEAALGTASGFWWTSQSFLALVIWSVFVGIEGRHRNIPTYITLSTILLAQFASLSTAQCLFFIILLLTPVPLTSGAPVDSQSHILTPHPLLVSIPALLCFMALSYLGIRILDPKHLSDPAIYNTGLWTSITTAGYFVLPILLATLFQPNYLHKVHRFRSTHAARKSYEDIFRALALTAASIHAYFTFQTFINESPPHKYLQHDYVWNTHSKEEITWIGRVMGVVGSIAGALSDNPVISQVGWDVLLSTVSLCLWSVVHGVDVSAMLRSSGLTWNVHGPPKMEQSPSSRALPKSGGEPSVSSEALEKAGDAIEELADTIEISPLPEVKGRGRGRPRKTSQAISKDHVYAHSAKKYSSDYTAAGAQASSSSSNSLRRSTKSQPDPSSQFTNEDDADATYQPTAATEKEVDHYDFDEGHEEGMAKETEAGVLSWGLFVFGGLGMVSAGVLGGESSGR